MPLMDIKQVKGGKTLQQDVSNIRGIVGESKEELFAEILEWLLSNAPENFTPVMSRKTRLAMLVSSAIIANNSEEPEPVVKNPYLSFIEEDGQSFYLGTYRNGKYWDGAMYYSVDTESWSEWDGKKSIKSSDDGKLYLRGKNNTKVAQNAINQFILTSGKRIHCEGNIENLLDWEVVSGGEHPAMANGCFAGLFVAQTSLVSAPELPATELTINCYNNMFNGTSITTPPELPATSLAENCYCSMFNGCTKLKHTPTLPSVNLIPGCYNNMFGGCTSLTDIPELPAIELAQACYYKMFYGCTSLSKLSNNMLLATTLATDCYTNMFAGCSSLTGEIHLPESIKANTNRLKLDSGAKATLVFDL